MDPRSKLTGSYDGFSRSRNSRRSERSTGSPWGLEDMRPAGSKGSKGARRGKASPERKPGGSSGSGVIAELTSDGRLGSASHSRPSESWTSTYPADSEHWLALDQQYGYTGGYNVSELDDDWAKNPDIFSVSYAFDHQSHEVLGQGAAKTPYAGIAAELTNDGRLRADQWAFEGHALGSSRGKGHGSHDSSWSREWKGGGRLPEESYAWPSPTKGKGKQGKGKKGKDKAPPNSMENWYGWSQSDQGWQKGSADGRVPDGRVPAYNHATEPPQVEQYLHWHAGYAELRIPKQETATDQKKQRRRRKTKKAALEPAMSAEEREVLARGRREELSAEKEAEAQGAPRLLTSTKDWEEVVADEHLRSWMSIRRSNPAVLAEDFQLVMARAPWKEIGGDSAEVPAAAKAKIAWMVAPGFQCHRRHYHGTLKAELMPDWMSGLMERWLGILSLDRDELPNCVEAMWFDDQWQDARWLCDDEALFRTPTQDIHVICIALGGPRIFRAGLRCGARKTPVRGTVSEVTLSHGDTCALEGRFQKHFVHQSIGQQEQNENSSSGEGYLHMSLKWIVKQSRNNSLQEPGASEAEEPSEEDVSSASAASDDSGDV